MLVLAYCGLRWSELAALRVARVDLQRGRLTVAEAMVEVNGGRLEWGTPKSHEARSVPVPRFLVEQLAAELAGKPADALVFTSTGGGPLRNRNARRDWFDRAAATIGEPQLTPTRSAAPPPASPSAPAPTSRPSNGCSATPRRR